MMRIRANVSGLVFCSLVFFGCANSVTYRVGGLPKGTGKLQIEDQRVEAQKKSKIMSAFPRSCWFGIYRLGDDQFRPDRIEILRNKIEESLGDSALGKTLTVRRFEVFNNIQAGLIKGTTPFGLAGSVPKPNITGCEDGFGLEKNPHNSASVVIWIDVGLNGRRISDKIIQVAPENNGPESLLSETTRRRVQLGIHEAVDRIADSLKVSLDKNP